MTTVVTTNKNNNLVNAPRFGRKALGSAGALACVVMLSGCFGGGDVSGEVEVIDKRSETLLSGDLEAVNGTYGAGCTNRSGPWSIEIEGGATLDNPELSVVLKNTACVLTVTSLQTTGGTLTAAPSIAMGASYKVAASAFEDEFYGNAKMDSVSFADNFVVTILYSDDPNAATDDNNSATFEVVTSSTMGDSVTVPNYTIEPDDLDVVVDAGQIVQSTTGSVTLTPGSQVGQTFVVVDASGLDTYAELDAAYIAGVDAPIMGNAIPAAAFTLVTEDLDTLPIRTLIIANTENGVASYQAFAITFHPAPVI